MQTVLQVICDQLGWQGGTLTQAIQAYKVITLEEQQKVVDNCKDIVENRAGKQELKLYFKGK